MGSHHTHQTPESVGESLETSSLVCSDMWCIKPEYCSRSQNFSSAVTQPSNRLQLYLTAGPAFEAVGVELVDMKNVDGTLDAEVMQLAADFEE